MVQKIVSGGQTGVDRAALDVALQFGWRCGGWCPKGRRAEDGVIPARYPLTETPTEEYAQRTAWNVRDADGSLILNVGLCEGGTAQTVEEARHLGKPCLVVDLERHSDIGPICDWVTRHHVRILNVAGPREKKRPGIYRRAKRLLTQLLSELNTHEISRLSRKSP